jgi:SAM-dependent methyltransferase
MKCLTCGTFFLTKYFPDEALSRVPITAYANVEFEGHLFDLRKEFFDYLLKISGDYVKLSSKRMLDVGCGFGHMLNPFRKGGFDVYGVEILDSLRVRLGDQGYPTFKYVADIPKEINFDIIYFIDSLCYFKDPYEVLNTAKGYLKEDGVIIARITNRGLLLDLFCRLGIDITSIFGTGKYNFGLKAFKIMLEKAGYKIIKVIYRERGKTMSAVSKAAYNLAAMVSFITKMEVSSGVIVIAKRS